MPAPARGVRALLLAPALTLALAAARDAYASPRPPPLVVDLGGGTELTLVLVEPGSFRQGSPAIEPGRGADEVTREVTLSAGFYIGKVPVTRGQFARFASESGYRTEAEKGTSGGSGWDGHALVQRKEFTWRAPGFPQSDTDPVTIVTYADAEAFASWATSKSRHQVTLPTEAQWEYAARAGTKTAWYGAAADAQATELGWFQSNAGNGTRPTATRKPNAWGLYDTSGDVYEWCRDWYGPYASGPATDPVASSPPSGDTPRRVLRGGSWLKAARDGRSAARYRNTPGSRNADNGFRVVAGVEVIAAAVAPASPTTAPTTTEPLPVVAPSSGSRGGELGTDLVLVALGTGLVAIFGAVIWLVARGSQRRPRAGASMASPDPRLVQTRIGADGFWIHAPHPPGTRVRYQANVGGVPVTDDVTLDGGPQGTFVYTGSPPMQVAIVAVTTVMAVAPLAGRGGGYRGYAMGAPNVHPPVPVRAPRGYPSAY